MRLPDRVHPLQQHFFLTGFKLSDGVLTVWTTSMLLGVCMWHLGTLWPVLAVMAGWVAPLVHIGDGVKWTQIYRRTLSCISDVIWMSMADFGLRLVFCVLECVYHTCYLHVVLNFCVFEPGLFFRFCATPVWCHINQSINHYYTYVLY